MKILNLIKNKDIGSMGIGAMIVFIAMVLVAGIAASVLIQTSTSLESQAMATGSQTTEEVAGGIAVFDIEGHVAANNSTNYMDALAITVRARAGSPSIDLNQSIIMISDGTKKSLLSYDYGNATHFNVSVNSSDGSVFGFKYTDLANDQFGILVLEDADHSLSRYNPVINTGDKVMLYINSNASFGSLGGIPVRTGVDGKILPEHGSPGVIAFRTPSSYSTTIYDLQ